VHVIHCTALHLSHKQLENALPCFLLMALMDAVIALL
jgi:hypothetical protein